MATRAAIALTLLKQMDQAVLQFCPKRDQMMHSNVDVGTLVVMLFNQDQLAKLYEQSLELIPRSPYSPDIA